MVIDAGTPAGTPLPSGKQADAFVVHRTGRLAIELCRERIGRTRITPVEELFVLQHHLVPSFAARGWAVLVDGVRRPACLTVDDLRDIGRTSVEAVLQCSGNGRAYFPHEMKGQRGPDWTVGAVGNVVWTGTPVAAVVDALGGLPDDSDAAYLTATGDDPLPGVREPAEEVVERSIPLAKALADCLLAWELNGAPVPHEHGGPLRLVVPGYYGINSVKWLGRIALTAAESRARLQRSSYRVRPVGTAGGPDQPTMWTMPLKSFVTRPSGISPLPAGPTDVYGVAFGGEQAVAAVDLSLDGGASWERTTLLETPASPYAWRRFYHRVELDAGRHVLCSRATDDAGCMQPEERDANERGYGNTAWSDHALALTVR